MSTAALSQGIKRPGREVDHLQLVPRWRIRLHGVVLNWLSKGTTLPQRMRDNETSSAHAIFTDCGRVSLRGMHYWPVETPHWLREVGKGRHWSINMLAAIVHQYYWTALSWLSASWIQVCTLSVLLEVPIDVGRTVWYHNDEFPAHYPRVAREVLGVLYPGHWIERNEPIPWPPRSPDLTSFDSFSEGSLER
jgi:hypothetical protein